MENSNNLRDLDNNNKSLKEYASLLRNNILPVVLISVMCLIVAIFYAVKAKNIYSATTVLKISKPKGSIMETPLMPEISDFGSDRFVSNEIEIMKSYTVRERVAKSLIDSFKVKATTDSFYVILNKESAFTKSDINSSKVKSVPEIAALLATTASIEQKRGLDIVEIKVESPSASEAALIANCYAAAYKDLDLDFNRAQLTAVKNFLVQQKDEKFKQLNEAENILEEFQKKGGIIAIDDQSSALIQQLTTFEAQKNSAKLDMTTSDKMLNGYKAELKKQDAKLANYVEGFETETYIKTLQEQLAKAEVTRDVAISNNKEAINSPTVKELNLRISELRNKINQKFDIFKQSAFASAPEELKTLAQKVLEESLKSQALKASSAELGNIVNSYETKFNQLPKTITDYARLTRSRESLEKLYLAIENKYQEALINEQSEPGNVLLIDVARMAIIPSKPNRPLIVIVGLIIGLGIAFGYVFVKNYFDNTVKSPEDIENRNINVLAWIPQIEGLSDDDNKEFEFIVAKKPDSIPSEAFRSLRTRLQFARPDKGSIKTILVTSSTPQEGKTVISVNLAGSFAQTNKKVLLVDCDFRKPRVHSVFRVNRFPGLVDYFFNQATLEQIVKKTELSNLDFISTGTIPPNPAETLESNAMKDFLALVSEKYDLVILDSPPIIAVTDSEILTSLVDATLLVVSAGTTETEIMEKSVGLLSGENSTFIGTVLNNFTYKSGYGSYYKYYYYYTTPSKSDSDRQKKIIRKA